MKNLLALLLLTLPFAAMAQTDNAIAPFVPAGWKVIATEKGDLNKDGTDDMALVIENTDKAKFVQNPDKGFEPEVFNTNPRQLLVLFKDKSGNYTLADKNEGFIPPQHNPDMPCLQDPFLDSGEMLIKKGVLSITLQTFESCGAWAMSNVTYTFRYQEGSFKLIGFDLDEGNRVSGELFATSINFLTGKKSATEGENLFEDNPSNPKTTWENINITKLLTLSELKYETEMNY